MSTTARKIFDFLVTRDLEPEILDRQGKSVLDPQEAEMFSFEWRGPSGRDYGTVVILLNPDVGVEVYAADNLGRTMEPEDKDAWFGTGSNDGFLPTLKNLAVTSDLHNGFGIQNINRLKYTMQGMAAIREGLFEGYYGRGRRVSYSDQPQRTRLMIRHNRDLDEGDARYRAIESIFVETADGERFRVPSRSLTHGRALARHVAEGGNPYDAFGQHINEVMSEIATLGRFLRSVRDRELDDSARDLVESAVRHYGELKAKARRMISRRGYHEEIQHFDPAEAMPSAGTTDEIREMFQPPRINDRVEQALPILAKLQEKNMKEIQEFAHWAHDITEGTWARPEDADSQRRLRELMSEPLPVGVDAINATEQLYDLVGDDELYDQLGELAKDDPDADARPLVLARLEEMGFDVTDYSADAAAQPQADTEPAAEPNTVPAQEDLDTDGVMMTRASNMSSESVERDLARLVELARR